MRYGLILTLFLLCPALQAAVRIEQPVELPPLILKKPAFDLEDNTHGPRMVFTQADFQNRNAATLSEVLTNFGGIRLLDITGNGSQAAISLRGFGSNASSNSLLLINGMPITNPDLAPPDLNLIPLNEIKFIEIIAGSESVIYGDQAVGGVVNIHTDYTPSERALITCTGGSYEARQCYLSWHDYYSITHYKLMGTTQSSDNYRAHNHYTQNQLIATMLHPHGLGLSRVTLNLSQENMQYPGALSAQQVRQNRRQANNDTDFFKDWHGFVHYHLTQQWPSNWQTSLDLTGREMRGSGILTAPFSQSRLTYYLHPELKGSVYNVKIRSGLDWQQDNYHLGSLFGTTDNAQQRWGAFIFGNFPWHAMRINAGARAAELVGNLASFTKIHAVNRAIATTLGANYSWLGHAFYLRRAGSFRFPKADENAATTSGTADLRTQRGVAYETGVAKKTDQWRYQLDVYRLWLKDEIAFDPTQTPAAPFGSNRNLAPTSRTGFNTSLGYHLRSNLTLGAQYNYVNARFQNGGHAGKRIPLVAENIFLINLNYHFMDHWQWYTEAVYTGSTFPANDDANVSGKIGGYTVINTAVRYLYRNLSCSFRINNLFNRAYYYYTDYQTSLGKVFFYPAPERNFILTVKLAFL